MVKKNMVMKRSLTRGVIVLINIGVLSLSSSCDNSIQNKIEADKENKLTSSLPKMALAHVPNDTLPFERLADLLSFFEKKDDTIEALKKTNKNSSLFATEIMDATYNLAYEKVHSIDNFLWAHEKNAENFEGLKYIILSFSSLQINRIDSLFHQYPDSLQLSGHGKWLLSRIEKRKITETQSHFNLTILDVKFYTAEGKTITLKEISSKYILLDFWTSWCSPCRYQNRILAKEKDLIEERGRVSIVAISLDDKKQKWIKAAKEDSLNYLNISDLKGFESYISKELKIKTIPYNVLINKQGKILANNLWGNRLIEFVKSLP